MSRALKNLKKNLHELGIEPKKSLGQNFLISDHVIDKIVQQVINLKPEVLVEIGPGLGALTSELKSKFNNYKLIELDKVFSEFWRRQGMEVFEADALTWDWQKLQNFEKKVLVSNLPYQISSSLVIDRSIDCHQFQAMVLMFQKEVAQRIKAVPNTENYGMLSVVAQEFWTIENLLEAGPRDFLPPPKIASRVLVFQQKPSRIKNKLQFLKFIKACFLHRRKLMASNLKEGMAQFEDNIQSAFMELKLKPQVRAQELKINEFVDLYGKLGYQ